MRVYDRLTLPGIAVTKYGDGSVVHEKVINASEHDYIRAGQNGDYLHSTPYRHIRVKGSGTMSMLTEVRVDISSPPYRRWDFISDRSAPFVPTMSDAYGVSYADEFYQPSLSARLPKNLRVIADNRCLADCAQSKFKLGETLVELCETVSYVTSKAEHLFRVLVDLKHGRFSNALKQLGIRESYMRRSFAERWLESQFAIRPLIGEIEQARQLAYAQTLGDVHYWVSARGTAKESVYKTTAESRTEAETRVVTHAKWQISEYELRALMRLGLANPLELLWEFLPLSWAVDYVVGLGDWFSQLMAPMGCSHIDTCRTVRTTAVVTIKTGQVARIGDFKYTTQSEGTLVTDAFQRYPDLFAPTPTLEFKFPLNVNQLANIAALVAVFRGG